MEAVGGNTGDGIGSGSGNRSNSTTVTINGGRIEKAQGGKGYSIFDGGDGIHSDDVLTISGTATIVSAIGGSGGSGIYSGGQLFISDNATITNAKGGEGQTSGGYGIRGNVALTIEGGKIEQATGGEATGSHGIGGTGIGSNGKLTISGGEIQQATGGNATGTLGTGGSGIRGGSGWSGGSSNKIVEISGGTITKAKGGDGKASGGNAIHSDGDLKIEGGTIGSLTTDDNGKQIPAPTTGALGGNAATGEQGGHGIYSKGQLFISGSADITNAKGGDGKTSGGDGIRSDKEFNISGGKIEQATGGDSKNDSDNGGSGISSGSMLTISDSANITNATGGSGKSGGHGLFGTAMKIISSAIGTAKGGEGKTSGGNGIYGVGKLTISDGAVITNATGGNATGIDGTGGHGIYSDGKLSIEKAAITNATGGNADNGTGGSGIRGDGSSDDFKLSIDSANITNATGGNGKRGGSGLFGKTLKIISSAIRAIGGRATGEGDYTGGAGIVGSESLTIEGRTTVQATGGSADSGTGGSGIFSDRSLSISGGAINATGGSGKSGGAGIASSGTVSISNGKIEQATGGRATGEDGTGGSGIRSNGTLTIRGGEIRQTSGGDATGTDGTGGSGISSGSVVKIWGGTIKEATGGSGKSGGDGIGSYGNLTIFGSAKIRTAQGGASTDGNGGSGISSGGILTIEGSANIGTAQGGASTNGTGGDGIHSGSVVKISGGAITNSTGGNATGENSTGGSGIGGNSVNVEGGTINTTGGSGKSGGAGIDGDIVSISNTNTPLDITATSPDADKAIQSRDGKTPDKIIHLEENGKLGLVTLVENGVTRLFHNGVYTASLPGFSGSETHPLGDWVITKKPTCTEPGERRHSCKVKDCVVTETEELPALGHQWSGWMPVEGGSREYRICAGCGAVEYRDVSHSSSDSTLSTGLRVLDPAQADIFQNAQLVRLSQISDVLYIDVSHETASLQGVLSDLTGLRSERIGTIVFSTERCTSTLSLSDVAALGAGDTPFTLSHSGSTATFIVGGADHSALLR